MVLIFPPPLESVRMKLQRRVRGQIWGSWVCPVHLNYFQLAPVGNGLVVFADLLFLARARGLFYF